MGWKTLASPTTSNDVRDVKTKTRLNYFPPPPNINLFWVATLWTYSMCIFTFSSERGPSQLTRIAAKNDVILYSTYSRCTLLNLEHMNSVVSLNITYLLNDSRVLQCNQWHRRSKQIVIYDKTDIVWLIAILYVS